jgi:IS30 family transposase
VVSQFSSSWVKTLTFDNGKEFAFHEEAAKVLNVKTYFTRPYTSQDIGTVENRIGVIRRFFPKKTDFRYIRDDEIKWVETTIKQPSRKEVFLTLS